jgi:hypothetical protein
LYAVGRLAFLSIQVVVNPVARFVSAAGADPRVGDARRGFARATA